MERDNLDSKWVVVSCIDDLGFGKKPVERKVFGHVVKETDSGEVIWVQPYNPGRCSCRREGGIVNFELDRVPNRGFSKRGRKIEEVPFYQNQNAEPSKETRYRMI